VVSGRAEGALIGEKCLSLDAFFNEKSERSAVKARVVAKYFSAWANVVKGASKARDGRIAYIDLFAGPGRYLDGSKSTPLLVLEQAIADPDLSQMLVGRFNDFDRNNTHALQDAIDALPNIERLKYKPSVSNHEVGDQIVGDFEHRKLVPTFFFVDPWGYKGLSLRLVNSVLKNWGCDCVFFFNYNRINMGLMNSQVETHMNALFGRERADALRTELRSCDPSARETAILRAMTSALVEMGGRFVQPFCFKDPSGTRTSHHLIFVTKDFKGYEIMKPIMAKESTTF